MRANHDQSGVTLACLGLAVILAGCGGGGGASGPATSSNVASAPAPTTGGNDTQPSETTESVSKETSDVPQPEASSTLPEEESVVHAEVKLSNDSLLITVPQGGAIDVALDSPIVLAYKETLDPGAVVGVLLASPSGPIPSRFYLTQSSVVVVPESGLQPETLHTVRVVTTTANGGNEKTAAQIDFTTGSYEQHF